jgi:hypothetical protein
VSMALQAAQDQLFARGEASEQVTYATRGIRTA